jgi:hypothetical protein
LRFPTFELEGLTTGFTMVHTRHSIIVAGLAVLAVVPSVSAKTFEGYIHASMTRGGPVTPLLYTVGTNCVRVEVLETNAPNAINLVDRSSGQVTLVFPNNRSFMRLASGAAAGPSPGMPGGMPAGMDPNARNAPGAPGAPGMPAPPQLPGPPGGLPPGIGPTNFSGMPGARPMPQRPQMPQMPQSQGMPAMPMMPMMGENIELQATGTTTNLLGYECQGFEIKQRGETMTIWATDQLLPFQIYMPREPQRFGPPRIEEQWGKAVTEKKLFPERHGAVPV